MNSLARKSARRKATVVSVGAVALMMVVAILVIRQFTRPPQEVPEIPQQASPPSVATTQALETNTSPEPFKDSRDYAILIPALALKLPRAATTAPVVTKRPILVHDNTVVV